MRVSSICFLLLMLFSLNSHAKSSIDGSLSEEHWDNAVNYQNFKTVVPLNLNQPENNTKAMVYTDPEGIYIGFINATDARPTAAQTSLVDQDINADYNEVILDFSGDGLTAYGFKVGRNGAIQDSVWRYPNLESADWDAQWQHAVSEQEGAWISEIFIPWSVALQQEEQQNNEKPQIGIYLSRWERGLQQKQSTPSITSDSVQFLSEFTAIDVVKPKASKLDFFPFLTLNYDNIDDDTNTEVGIDVFWQFKNNQQINLTINPDFGQVEQNELVVNFSAIETFFSEKRPFFNENHELLDITGPEELIIVHTPRIGGEPDLEEDDASDIMAAGRYSYLGQNVDFGALFAREGDGRESDGRDYLAMRGQYKQKGSSIGLTFTHTDRPSLDRDAQIVVMDGSSSISDNWEAEGQIIYTNAEESSKSKDATSGWATATYEPSETIQHAFGVVIYDEDMQIDDLGFVERVDLEKLTYELGYEWPEVDSDTYRDMEVIFYAESRQNSKGDDLPEFVNIEWIGRTKNNWRTGLEAEYTASGIEDLETRGNNSFKLPDGYKLRFEIETDGSKRNVFEFSGKYGEKALSERFWELGLFWSSQLFANTSLEFETEYLEEDSWLIWQEDNLLNEYQRQEWGISLSLFSQFTDNQDLRIQIENVALKAQGVTQWQAISNNSLLDTLQQVEDFSISELALQVRYRYEISRLSNIYLVYSRGVENEFDDRERSFGDLFSDSYSERDDENILFKVTLQW